jgi:hypothetical protein
MEIKKITFPNHPMELFRYYYPNSLQGQENSAENLMELSPDVHTKVRREDGTETCSCGLVYASEWLGWDSHYGHRHHQTGELQPVARVKDEYFYSDATSGGETTSYRCEYCGADEVGDLNFFSSKTSGSKINNVHNCVTDDFPLARQEFLEGLRLFQFQQFFFTPTPNSKYLSSIGNVSLIADPSGLRVNATGENYRETLLKLLENRALLISLPMSEIWELSAMHAGAHKPWKVSDTRENWYYRKDPNNSSPDGFISISPLEVSDLSFSKDNVWGDPDFVEEKITGVKCKMTKDYFVVYGNRNAIPVAQVPVLGLI